MKNSKWHNLLLILLILFSIYIAPAKTVAAEKPVTRDDTITFIHITDPHVCNLTGYHPFFIQKRQHVGNNGVRFINFFNTKPEISESDFVVITGDNVDYYEAQTEKGGMLDTQIEQYARLLDKSNIPVYLTLGNHDIASYFVSPALEYTNNQLCAEKARAAWMRNASCFRDGTYYSRNFKIDTIQFRFIFLDNGYYKTKEFADSPAPFIMDQSQLLWLDGQLKASDSDIEILFMHMPLSYRKTVDKAIITEPLNKLYPKSEFNNLFSILERNSSARLLFVGHNHDNIINNYSYSDGKLLTQVMTGCFGRESEPDNWRIIKLTKNNIIIYYTGSYSEVEYVIGL